MKLFVLIISLTFLNISDLIGQNEHSITLSETKIITPSKYDVKINCITPNILGKKWMKESGYLEKDSVIQIVNSFENINIIEQPNNISEQENSEFLDILYVEVIGIETYQKLKKSLAFKAPISTEKYHIEDFEEQEQELIEKILKQSRINVEKQLKEKDQKIVKMLNYIEIDKSEEKPKQSGFAILKEKFIEENYKGNLVNEYGQVILKKEILVNYEIK